jgi:hypothetical protein
MEPASDTVVNLPQGRVYRRPPSPVLWLDLTRHGERIRRSAGTADLAAAVQLLQRIAVHGIAPDAPRQVADPGFPELLALLADAERMGQIRAATALTYRDKIGLLQRSCRERGIAEPRLIAIDRPWMESYIAWRRTALVTQCR